MNRALALTIPLMPHETATSFASRLARRNGVPRLITFCSDVGINYFALANGDAVEVKRLADLGGVDLEALAQWTPCLLDAGWFRLNRERIKFTAFSRTSMRLCPLCISDQPSENGGQLGPWQLTSIRVCERHACLLVPVPKHGNGNDTFDVMAFRSTLRKVDHEPANPAHMGLQRYLLRRLETDAQETWLDRLPFHVASQTCEGLGLLITKGPKANREKTIAAEWLEAGAAGFEILSGGPSALRAALQQVQNAQPIDSTLYRTRFRVFFEWLRYRDDDRDFDVIRNIVREYILDNFPIATGDMVLGQPCPEQRVHSLATARSAYGISAWKLGRRLAALGLVHSSGNSRAFVLDRYIPADGIRHVATEVSGLLNATQAGRHLGIDRALVSRLTQRGLIKKFYTDHNSSPLYHPDELDAFAIRIRGLVTLREAEGNAVDLSTAAHQLTLPVDRILELILEQKITLYAGSAQSVFIRDLRVKLGELRHAMTQDPIGTMNPKTAAKTLGVSMRTVRGLLDGKHLNARIVKESKTGRFRRFVCANSLDAFKLSHITVSELAARNGRLAGAEAILQMDRGVHPLPLGERCNAIFRRCEV